MRLVLILLLVGTVFGGEVKNLVFMVGDGMGIPIITITRERFSRLAIDDLPATALIVTRPLGGGIPDSASSMTAYMTGEKVGRGAISYKDGKPLTTILEMAEEKGKCTGIVTNTRVTHATPAAAYAHVPDRHMEEEIGRFLLPSVNPRIEDGVEVIIGGGKRKLERILGSLEKEGYRVTGSLEELRPGLGKVIVLLAEDHLGFGAPLPLMVESALNVLRGCEKGFVLIVEGGLIDIALHRRDLEAAIRETYIFDRAVKKVLEMVELDDTLIVVTADHGHAVLDTRLFRTALGLHTSEDVVLKAVGKGSERFRGTLENVDVFHILKTILGF